MKLAVIKYVGTLGWNGIYLNTVGMRMEGLRKSKHLIVIYGWKTNRPLIFFKCTHSACSVESELGSKILPELRLSCIKELLM